MKFNKEHHQKVRYEGHLYVVILQEFPDYHQQDDDYPIVLHPVGNDWVVQITNPQVRKYLTVPKGASVQVAEDVQE